MAEIVVNLVLGKLADAVVQEALSLYGVRDKAEKVQRQLEWIQAFLKDADAKRHKDERVKQWVKEVREVGDLIEDVLDKFLEEVGRGKPEGLRNVLKRIGKMPVKMISKHKLGSEIDKINQRIFEITENRKKYGIEELKESSSAGVSVMLPIRPFVHPDIDELEVVGFEVDKKTIVKQLTDTNTMRRAVITIVEAGGSRKTTLAKEVYKSSEVKRHFDISIWLTISQNYKLNSILMKLLKEIGSERQNEEEEYLIIELNKCMKEKRYLVVLDDVWSSNVWTQLNKGMIW
ncbi:disease resistance protein RPP13-like [Carex rostrata]